jgi:hypothetical protein
MKEEFSKDMGGASKKKKSNGNRRNKISLSQIKNTDKRHSSRQEQVEDRI